MFVVYEIADRIVDEIRGTRPELVRAIEEGKTTVYRDVVSAVKETCNGMGVTNEDSIESVIVAVVEQLGL